MIAGVTTSQNWKRKKEKNLPVKVALKLNFCV
jgi:hypothetical protein